MPPLSWIVIFLCEDGPCVFADKKPSQQSHLERLTVTYLFYVLLKLIYFGAFV